MNKYGGKTIEELRDLHRFRIAGGCEFDDYKAAAVKALPDLLNEVERLQGEVGVRTYDNYVQTERAEDCVSNSITDMQKVMSLQSKLTSIQAAAEKVEKQRDTFERHNEAHGLLHEDRQMFATEDIDELLDTIKGVNKA